MSMIEIKGLCKSFGDHEVLKGIDQNVEEGEVLCIVGPQRWAWYSSRSIFFLTNPCSRT